MLQYQPTVNHLDGVLAARYVDHRALVYQKKEEKSKKKGKKEEKNRINREETEAKKRKREKEN